MAHEKAIDYEKLRRKNQKELEKVLFGIHEVCLKAHKVELGSKPGGSLGSQPIFKKR